LNQIQINYEKQHAFKDGRQKFVVTVTNASKKLFKGSIRVEAVDGIDKSVDSDTLLEFELPPYAEKIALLWFKEPDRIATLKYRISGNLYAVSTAKIDVPFEELGLRTGQSYMSVFVYTPAKDRASLLKIVKIYKKRYSSLHGFRIAFFSDRNKAAHDFPMSDDALSCWIGNYSRNNSTGLDELQLLRAGEPIK
jgi:hypothetical protein